MTQHFARAGKTLWETPPSKRLYWLTSNIKKKNVVDQRLAAQSTKTELSDKLWIIIGVIGGFSIGAILAVKLFTEAIQIEWVASGQVIQFVTVMILLNVIIALTR